jgi:hypothetical protein
MTISIVFFLLFESLVKGWKQIKGPNYYQGQAIAAEENISITFAITNYL